METKAYQIEPSRCKSVASVQDVLNGSYSDWLAQEKKDDIRYLLQIRPNESNQNYLTSRRISVQTGNYVEKQDRYTKIRDYKFIDVLNDSVFDGGISGDKEGISSDVQSNATLDGEYFYNVWGILRLSGRDVTGLSELEIHNLLLEMKGNGYFPNWVNVLPISRSPSQLLTEVLVRNGEGIVLKEPSGSYASCWIKVKKEITEDVIIFGYEESTAAKYAPNNWIKSVRFGQWVEVSTQEEIPTEAYEFSCSCFGPHPVGKVWRYFHDCGKCSGMTEPVRDDISRHREEYIGRVMEIESQQRLKSGKFRHPRFIQFREDKNASDCVWGGNVN